MRPRLLTRPHFGELDSLRGFAALTVVFHHFVLLGTPTSYSKLLLHFVANGHSAVMMFFVLSGLVLALPIAGGHSQIYASYLARRVCRIYLPYLAALSIALVGDVLFHERQSLRPFLDHSWSVPVSLKLVAQHVAFIGDYDYAQVNPAFWSLVHEMRISLIFPPFCLVLYRLRVAGALVLLGILTCLGTVLSMQMPSGARTFATLHYLAIFGLGAVLARNLPAVTTWYRAAGRPLKYVVGLLAALLYVSRTKSMVLRIGCLADVPVALGATLLIALSLNSRTLKAVLGCRLPRFLGRVSYSLYLVHVTGLFVLAQFLAGRRSLLFLLYLTVALVCAQALWKFVEQPSIQLGKRMSQKVEELRTSSAAGAPVELPQLMGSDSDREAQKAEARQEWLTT